MSQATGIAAGLSSCRESIAKNSKSFALASRVLGPDARDDAAVVYAFCRRADDAIDLAHAHEQPEALARLRAELDAVYSEDHPRLVDDPALRELARVVRKTRIPRAYLEELLQGMDMDVRAVRYESLDDLLHYCFRVAGTVGLMMCHVLGVSDARARKHAAHLGMGMQLTNICRDVLEDFERGRLYLPARLLGTDAPTFERPLSAVTHRAILAPAVATLLAAADGFYASATLGIPALSFRAAWAVRTAAFVYRAIGTRLRRRGCDVFAGRSVVPTWQKLGFALLALALTLSEVPTRARRVFVAAPIEDELRFPTDVVLL